MRNFLGLELEWGTAVKIGNEFEVFSEREDTRGQERRHTRPVACEDLLALVGWTCIITKK